MWKRNDNDGTLKTMKRHKRAMNCLCLKWFEWKKNRTNEIHAQMFHRCVTKRNEITIRSERKDQYLLFSFFSSTSFFFSFKKCHLVVRRDFFSVEYKKKFSYYKINRNAQSFFDWHLASFSVLSLMHCREIHSMIDHFHLDLIDVFKS